MTRALSSSSRTRIAALSLAREKKRRSRSRARIQLSATSTAISTFALSRGFCHHPLGELTDGHLAVRSEVADADVRDLTLSEEAAADQIASPLLLRLGEQPRLTEVREIVLRLRDLCFVRRDPAEDLGSFVRSLRQ